MTNQSDHHRDLNILETIEQDPETTQATLASQLGVAVGTVNWHLRRLIDKGYVKVQRAQRRKLRYMITAEGIALRARLTLDYINNSFQLYRLVRQRTVAALKKLHSAGINEIRLEGDGDVAEVCRLTCLEQGFEVLTDLKSGNGKPDVLVRVIGLKLFIDFAGSEIDDFNGSENL